MWKLSCVLLFLFCTHLEAQNKYGHVNLGNLIAAMPETKDANTELETYQAQLVEKGEKMAAGLTKKVKDYEIAIAGGGLSPVEQEKRLAVLRNEQQEILAFERELGQLVNVKRQELLQPIFDKAQGMINEVAKERGYSMVFDTSGAVNGILFSVESDDIISFVKAKMGL